MSLRPARTAGNTITTRSAAVAMMNARLIGRVTKTEGSPSETYSARRRHCPPHDFFLVTHDTELRKGLLACKAP